MPKILCVPTHLNALFCSKSQNVVESMADFSRLPYSDGTKDHCPDIAYISEDIVSPPSQNHNFRLKKGIHLHWNLPKALTKGKHNTEGTVFPAVPNRWLITRQALSGIPKKEWVLESDYIFPEGKGWSAGSVSYPVPPVAGQAPFRFLGRKMTLAQWLAKEENPTLDMFPTATYLEKLTAVGYGEPAFAAFYPNCHSVFGFHDSEIQDSPPTGLEYKLIGWYSDTEQDYANTYNRLISDFKTHFHHIHKKNPTSTQIVTYIKDQLNWEVEETSLDTIPEKLVCYAKLIFRPADNITHPVFDERHTSTIKIALGNTGTEALAALVAQNLSADYKHQIEDQIENALLSPQLGHLQQDIGPKLQEARHEKGFVPASSGCLWTISPKMTTNTPDSEEPKTDFIPLPPELAVQLDQLNHLQFRYDHALRAITALQKQLFSDWYKFMLTSYPPEASHDDYPDVDEVRFYIKNKSLPALEDKKRQTGQLSIQTDAQGQITEAIVATSESTLALQLAESINATLAAVLEHNIAMQLSANEADAQLKGNYLLQQIPAPRFWRPREPHILITGDIARTDARHGQTRYQADYLLPCHQRDIIDLSFTNQASLDEVQAAILTLLQIETTDHQVWKRQPWSPLLLDWEVGFFPAKKGSNHTELSQNYSPDYIIQNYELLDNASELTVNPSSVAVSNTENAYSGRSILSTHAGRVLSRAFEDDFIRLLSKTGMKQTFEEDLDETIVWYQANHHFIHQLYSGANEDQIPSVDELFRFALTWVDLKQQFFDNLPESIEGNAKDNWLQQNANMFFEWLQKQAHFETYVINAFLAENSKINISAAEEANFLNTQLDDFLLWYQESFQIDLKQHFFDNLSKFIEDDKKDNWLKENATMFFEWLQKQAHFEAYIINAFLAENGKINISAAEEANFLNTQLDTFLFWYQESFQMDLKQHFFDNLSESIEGNEKDNWLQQNANMFFKWLREQAHFETYTINAFLVENDKTNLSQKEKSDFLNTQLDAFLLWYQQKIQQNLHAAIAISAYEQLKDIPSVSQSLGGFNQALLMHRQTLQMGIADPLAFTDKAQESFVASVKNGIGRQNKFAPAPINSFNPIRAGVLQFIRMQLVDSFGQYFTIEPNAVNTIYGEAYGVGNRPDLMTLAPRIVQPARLNFRWLSAAQGLEEMNAIPLSSPICGWFLPNNLDNSLAVYKTTGEALGIIDSYGVWHPFPGQDAARFSADTDIPTFIIANPHLRRVVNKIRSTRIELIRHGKELIEAGKTKEGEQLVEEGEAFISDFISTLDNALENIDPDNFAAHQSLALLMGRPFALVRAFLNLELMQPPATQQSWQHLYHKMDGAGEDNDQFTQVEFPIRLGEYRQLNDGLLGYWKEKATGELEDIFYTPQSHEDSHPLISSHQKVKQSIDNPPQLMSMLLDPRGVVHATSGVLPTKAINIPANQYQDALKKIQITFLTSPILTASDKLEMELPTEEGYTWSWIEKDRHRWKNIGTEAMETPNPKANFSRKVMIREGWLKLEPDSSNE